MRAAHRLGVSLPRRVAVLLAAAVQSVRDRLGRLLPTGTCLAIVAAHFFAIRRRRDPQRAENDRGEREAPQHLHAGS